MGNAQKITYESNPFKLFRPSFEAIKLAWKPMLLLGLLVFGFMIALIILIAALAAVSRQLATFLGLLGGLFFILYVLGAVAYATSKILLESVRGRRLSIGESLPEDKLMPLKFMFTVLLIALAFLGGLILLIIPGIIFLGWFGMGTYVLVDEGIWGVAALKRSKKLATGRVADVLGASFLLSFFAALARIPVVGLFALVISFILLPLPALRYNSLLALKSQPHWDKTPISRWNYLVIIAAIIMGGIINRDNPYHFGPQSTPSLLENNGQPY